MHHHKYPPPWAFLVLVIISSLTSIVGKSHPLILLLPLSDPTPSPAQRLGIQISPHTRKGRTIPCRQDKRIASAFIVFHKYSPESGNTPPCCCGAAFRKLPRLIYVTRAPSRTIVKLLGNNHIDPACYETPDRGSASVSTLSGFFGIVRRDGQLPDTTDQKRLRQCFAFGYGKSDRYFGCANSHSIVSPSASTIKYLETPLYIFV